MLIMTQDKKTLFNSDQVKQFYIDDFASVEEVALMAATDNKPIFLGGYRKFDDALLAMKFIGCCLVDENSANKITQVPSHEDMALKDTLFGEKGPADAIEKLMAAVMGKN